MKNRAEKFAEELKNTLGDNLKSFALYGSAAAGEIYRTSDINTILVVENAEPERIKTASKPVRSWTRNGNPAPLIFTVDGLKRSADVFPIEFFDIKDNHRVLSGRDYFNAIRINPKNLRLELERELKTMILRLRSAYVICGGETRAVRELLARSVSGFTAILRGVIRLYGKKAPVKKYDTIAACPEKLKLNKAVIFDILSIKEGSLKPDEAATRTLFDSYMKEVVKLRSIIDRK
ncbi:MAG: hypothetical protein LLG37_04810 [Spirochaetia bacterium]|nr:hypothetical protein [Spirochaetia bacterium]